MPNFRNLNLFRLKYEHEIQEAPVLHWTEGRQMKRVFVLATSLPTTLSTNTHHSLMWNQL